jgi:hypothetical protein
MSPMKDRYEMTAEPQRDITPEQASKRLRECVIWNCIETVQFPRADQQYRVSFGITIGQASSNADDVYPPRQKGINRL